MVDRVDEHRDAENVGEQNEFLPHVRAFLAGARQEVDRPLPFGKGEIDVAHEAVEMAHQRQDDLLEPRVARAREALQHLLRELLIVILRHFGLLRLR